MDNKTYSAWIALVRGLNTSFGMEYGDGKLQENIKPFVMEFNSDGESEKYGWLGAVPVMKKWVDELESHGLLSYDHTIPNETYGTSIKVKRQVVEDQQFNGIQDSVKTMAEQAREFPANLFFDALEKTETSLAYDGQPFFSNSHVYFKGNDAQSNIVTGAGVTTANIKSDFSKALISLRRLKNAYGQPWNQMVTPYVVGPVELEDTFLELFNAETLANNSNVFKGRAMYVTNPRISDVNDWYLFNTASRAKAFVLQNRIAPAPLQSYNEDKDEYTYRVRARYGFGNGLWERAVKIKNA